ncbi:MAG: hypothetical protein R3C11_10045 [Planctomycetaceae bacterium]
MFALLVPDRYLVDIESIVQGAVVSSYSSATCIRGFANRSGQAR